MRDNRWYELECPDGCKSHVVVAPTSRLATDNRCNEHDKPMRVVRTNDLTWRDDDGK